MDLTNRFSSSHRLQGELLKENSQENTNFNVRKKDKQDIYDGQYQMVKRLMNLVLAELQEHNVQDQIYIQIWFIIQNFILLLFSVFPDTLVL